MFLFSIQERRRKSFNQCLQNFFVLFAIIKNQPIKLQMVVFVVKYGALYGGIPDSEQLGTDTIWGYPEYGASVRHIVSPGLDGLTLYGMGGGVESTLPGSFLLITLKRLNGFE